MNSNENGAATPESSKKLKVEDNMSYNSLNLPSTREPELPTDVGSRQLTEDKINKLTELLGYLYGSPTINHKALGKSTHKLSQMLYGEDICFGSAVKLFECIGSRADFKILIDVYNSSKQEPVLESFYELTFDDKLGYPLDRSKAMIMENEVSKLIKKSFHDGKLVKELGSDVYLLLDYEKKQTFRETINYSRKGDKLSNLVLVLEVCLKELTVYDNPICDEPRQFRAKFLVNGSDKPLVIGPGFSEEIITILKNGAYIASKSFGGDAITNSLNLFVQEKLAEMKSDIEIPGFFYNPGTKSLISAKYDVKEPNKEELQKGLKVLEEFSEHFKDVKLKLATIFKWGLVAPFSFAIKQMGAGWMPWLFLYGQSQSGKSTLGQMVLYMWNEPDDETNSLGGGSFDTEARIGGALSRTTFPIVVDEPGGVFARDALVEIIKNAVMKKIVRSKYKEGYLGAVGSYAPVILTSNIHAPPDGAFNRRMQTLRFTYEEKKSDEEITQFEELYQLNSPTKCRLNALKSVTQAVACEIRADPKILEKNWKDAADHILRLIYTDAGMDIPEWLMQWSKIETMDDLDNEQRESIRILLAKRINQQIKLTPLVDADYRPVEKFTTDKIKSNNAFKDDVWHVVNEGLVPWMVPFQDKKDNEKYVCLTSEFRKELEKELKVSQPLKGIAELMGWEYQAVRLPDPKKVIKIRFDKFVETIYSRCVD